MFLQKEGEDEHLPSGFTADSQLVLISAFMYTQPLLCFKCPQTLYRFPLLVQQNLVVKYIEGDE